MRTVKFYTIVIVVLLFATSCKKELKTTTDTQLIETELIGLDSDCLDKRSINSVFQSCGGPCSMTYTETNFSIVDSLIKVKFDVERYIYEDLEDTFSTTIFVKCSSLNDASLVYYEGKEKENLLEVKVNSTSESFRKYADELCHCFNQKKETDNRAEKELEHLQNRHEYGTRVFEKIYNNSKLVRVPYNYSYEEITTLSDYTSFDLVLPKFSNLDGLMMAKLSFNDDSKLLLLSGSQESGEDQLYLLSLNNNYEIIDELLLYESREIEVNNEYGTLATTFKIGEDHVVTILNHQNSKGNMELISSEKYNLSSSGLFVNL